MKVLFWVKKYIFLLFLSVLILNQVYSEEDSLFMNEKITYNIRQYGIKVGTATLKFGGRCLLEGEDVLLITFKATGFNFLDEEKIYLDPVSFLPKRIERNLNIFGKKEKIIETYDPDGGKILIVKIKGDKRIERVIKKKGLIDNIYCFIYRYRRQGKFSKDESFEVNLPTRDVIISLEKRTKLKAAGKVFDAYFLQSKPRKYKIWFDSGPNKIPLRIDGAVGIAKTSMIMREYKKGED